VLINQSTVLATGGFPYIISNPGSYKLTGNLTMSATSAGAYHGSDIVITTNSSAIPATRRWHRHGNGHFGQRAGKRRRAVHRHRFRRDALGSKPCPLSRMSMHRRPAWRAMLVT